MTDDQTIPNVVSGDVVKQDAMSRSFRTLLQGIASVALTAVGTGLLALTGSVEWTTHYWTALGVSIGTAVVTAVISYVARYLTPPSQ